MGHGVLSTWSGDARSELSRSDPRGAQNASSTLSIRHSKKHCCSVALDRPAVGQRQGLVEESRFGRLGLADREPGPKVSLRGSAHHPAVGVNLATARRWRYGAALSLLPVPTNMDVPEGRGVISPLVEAQLASRFPGPEQDEARSLLPRRLSEGTDAYCEAVQLALIALSEGSLIRLSYFANRAQAHPGDVVFLAGFPFKSIPAGLRKMYLTGGPLAKLEAGPYPLGTPELRSRPVVAEQLWISVDLRRVSQAGVRNSLEQSPR